MPASDALLPSPSVHRVARFDNRPGIDLLRTFGLPVPIRQYATVVRGRHVRFDLCYPQSRLVIELDGRFPHWGKDRWQSDHDRDNASELAGWRVLRFTYADIHERPLYVATAIAEILGLRPARWTAGDN